MDLNGVKNQSYFSCFRSNRVAKKQQSNKTLWLTCKLAQCEIAHFPRSHRHFCLFLMKMHSLLKRNTLSITQSTEKWAQPISRNVYFKQAAKMCETLPSAMPPARVNLQLLFFLTAARRRVTPTPTLTRKSLSHEQSEVRQMFYWLRKGTRKLSCTPGIWGTQPSVDFRLCS